MLDNGPTVFEWVVLVGTVATPVLLIALSGIGWFIKSRFENAQVQEQEARRRIERIESEIREERIQIYTEILDPFIMLFAADHGGAGSKQGRGSRSGQNKNKQQRAIENITSIDYKKAAFKLSLFASDEVARAYNSLMQAAFSMETDGNDSSDEGVRAGGIELLGSFGALLLAIRKSVGNEKTELDNVEMLESLINDIRLHEDQLRRR